MNVQHSEIHLGLRAVRLDLPRIEFRASFKFSRSPSLAMTTFFFFSLHTKKCRVYLNKGSLVNFGSYDCFNQTECEYFTAALVRSHEEKSRNQPNTFVPHFSLRGRTSAFIPIQLCKLGPGVEHATCDRRYIVDLALLKFISGNLKSAFRGGGGGKTPRKRSDGAGLGAQPRRPAFTHEHVSAVSRERRAETTFPAKAAK